MTKHKHDTKHHDTPAPKNTDSAVLGNAADAPTADSIPPAAPEPEAAAPASPEPVTPPPDPLEEALARIAALEDQALRARADFDNYRKRTLREREEWTQRSLENIVRDLLPVLDNFEIGLERALADGTPAPLLEGFRMTVEQFAQALRKYSLEPLDGAGAFDPSLHEAVHHAPSPDIAAGKVIAQARRGYKFGGRVLRPTQVIVSSGPPPTDPAPAKEE